MASLVCLDKEKFDIFNQFYKREASIDTKIEKVKRIGIKALKKFEIYLKMRIFNINEGNQKKEDEKKEELSEFGGFISDEFLAIDENSYLVRLPPIYHQLKRDLDTVNKHIKEISKKKLIKT